jgi:RNA polymerase sigma-70 factor, ECF subfamily
MNGVPQRLQDISSFSSDHFQHVGQQTFMTTAHSHQRGLGGFPTYVDGAETVTGSAQSRPLPFVPAEGSNRRTMAIERRLLTSLERRDSVIPGSAISRDEELAFEDDLLASIPKAFRVVRGMGLTSEEAADVLQDASIRAWRHRGARRGEFQPWFIAIACREARRPRRRWLTVPAAWRAGTEAQDRDSRGDDLVEALARLPRRQRVAVSLRYVGDLAVADVAHALGIRESAAKQLLARGRESLRRAMSSQPHEGDS